MFFCLFIYTYSCYHLFYYPSTIINIMYLMKILLATTRFEILASCKYVSITSNIDQLWPDWLSLIALFWWHLVQPRFVLSVALMNWSIWTSEVSENINSFLHFFSHNFPKNGTKTSKFLMELLFSLSVLYTLPKFWHLHPGQPLYLVSCLYKIYLYKACKEHCKISKINSHLGFSFLIIKKGSKVKRSQD